MPVLAVTGNLASGKTTLLGLLKKKGAGIFNADDFIHDYYRDKKSGVYKKVFASFPGVFVSGRLSRRRLANVVFGCFEKLARLENIVYPRLISDLKEWIRKNRGAEGVFVAEIPLLFEKKLEKYFDAVIFVRADKKISVKRAKKGLGISKSMALKRLALFMPEEAKIKKSFFTVDNRRGMKGLKRQADELWDKLKNFHIHLG